MTKILSTYARSTGLRISSRGPNVKQAFFPVAHERYVTIQTGSAQAAKCYDLWGEVLRLLLPILNANKIAVLHLGSKDDAALPGVHDLRGSTSILQSNWLIGRSLLHMGNDSWLAHCAGWHYKPLVVLYGSTDPAPHGPYWSDPSKTSLLVSHRWNGRPTYGNEPIKTIDLIPPEKVANEVLRLLGISHLFTHQSRFWGALFSNIIFDLVPDAIPAPTFLPDVVINVRMDYLHNEDILAGVLGTGRRINIITKRPIARMDALSAHRAQILSYNQELSADEADQPSLDYVATVKALFPQHAFFTKETDIQIVANIRFKYLDHCLIEQTKDVTQADYITNSLLYLNREDTPQNRLDIASESSYIDANGCALRFRSNKVILAKGGAYPSIAHLEANRPIQSLGDEADVIDNPLFWKDLNHFAIYYRPHVN